MATNSELLAEANAAFHLLTLGQAVVEVRDSDGSTIRYSAADSRKLRAYIAELEAKVAGETSQARRPLRPVW